MSSPFVRAWCTAEILEQRGWPEPIPCEELEPDYPPHKVLDAPTPYANAESVAIIEHRPQLHELVSYLLTGDAGARGSRSKKVVSLSFDCLPETGAGHLEWLLTPKALRALS